MSYSYKEIKIDDGIRLKHNKYYVRKTINGVGEIHIGIFTCLSQAIIARDEFINEWYGSVLPGTATKHPLYSTWRGMINRCYDINNKEYFRYGGRGIKVSFDWKISFRTFVYQIGNKPRGEYTLDRINNNRGYSFENCKWSTPKAQANNRRKRNTCRKDAYEESNN